MANLEIKSRFSNTVKPEQATQPQAVNKEVETQNTLHTERDNFILPPKREGRSKRVALLMTPSIYAKLKIAATKQGRSLNDLTNAILETYLLQQPPRSDIE